MTLDQNQRRAVEATIRRHCSVRGWTLHAVNCRTTHCHVVVTAPGYDGEIVRDQFKAWTTRRLRENDGSAEGHRERWWTRGGSVRSLFDELSLEAAIRYTREAQDRGGSSFDRTT